MHRLAPALIAVLAVLAGCASGPVVDRSYSSLSTTSRAQFLVIHFTSSDFPSSLEILTRGPVSSHYLVRDDPPTIYGLVDEARRAHHAGESSWKGQTQLNAASIGIEIVNTGFRGGAEGGAWAPYPEAQMEAVMALVRDIVKRHEIRPDRVVGHSDIAPQRKVDPGPRFPWKRLADEGLVVWPDAASVASRRPAFEARLPEVAWFQQMLAHHGFAVPLHGELDVPTRNVLVAFQMKYRPDNFDGRPDGETAALLDALVNP